MLTSDDEITQRFSEQANVVLSHGSDIAEVERAARQTLTDASQELADALQRALQRASEPQEFFNQPVSSPNDRFEQCYALICRTFAEAEREPLDRFIYMLRQMHNPDNDHPILMIGRFWRASGSQAYDAMGNLQRFMFDPMSVTESVVSVIEGNYMSLRPLQVRDSGIGTIGHLATRERFRRGRGHGSALVRAFEAEIANIGKKRGETVELIALEAQTDSEAFWYKQGYRWAVGTRYAQPPLDFDPVTGERHYDEVPETLMVKLPNALTAASVSAELLTNAVRVMYLNWALEKTRTYPPAAARRAEEYVMGKVLGDFMASLPANGDVPLGPPPSL